MYRGEEHGGGLVPRGSCAGAQAGGFAHAPPSGRISGKTEERAGEGVEVARREDKPFATVLC